MLPSAVDDAIGWILLASVTAVVKSNFDPLETLRMVGLTVAFALVMWFAVRPILVRYFAYSLRENRGRLLAAAAARGVRVETLTTDAPTEVARYASLFLSGSYAAEYLRLALVED